ncbi:MAG: TRAP transporter small permease subunit [Planctomycetota bacterium]
MDGRQAQDPWLARAIDAMNDRIGRLTSWLLFAMILVAVVNTATRYIDPWVDAHLGSNAYTELQWYLFGVIFLLGGAHTLRRGAHVRVDVIYDRLGWRVRTWINLVGHCAFLLPVCALLVWMCWGPVLASWRDGEVSPDPGGLPRYWIKSMVPLGFVLLGLQGVSEILKRVQDLRRGHEVLAESDRPGVSGEGPA